MAKLAPAEIKRYLSQIEQALVGVIYGRVEIEVRGGHIKTVKRSEDHCTVLNGQPVGEAPEEQAR